VELCWKLEQLSNDEYLVLVFWEMFVTCWLTWLLLWDMASGDVKEFVREVM
jgi:hypothetical protein